ncbi:phage tail assembly chaperone [Peptostreptococcus faecalis]|uniref:phage tail assembly chaperone n=1 Tax=Peptostreptococcus faecalis TaxID=2045015 RepID=UPI000C7A91B3|nr:hypothetical protein [Peptostreptococcus faecalis]
MSKFQGFLKENAERRDKKELIISDRFKNEEGKAEVFVIKPIKLSRIAELRNENTTVDKNGNEKVNEVDVQLDLIAESVVSPDFKDVGLQESYGVLGEKELINEMLLIGEIELLTNEINAFNGMKGFRSQVDEVKN